MIKLKYFIIYETIYYFIVVADAFKIWFEKNLLKKYIYTKTYDYVKKNYNEKRIRKKLVETKSFTACSICRPGVLLFRNIRDVDRDKKKQKERREKIIEKNYCRFNIVLIHLNNS